MTQGHKVDISPNHDGGILKEIIRQGPDQGDKPWKGDRVQVSFMEWFQLEIHIFQSNSKPPLVSVILELDAGYFK